MGGGISVIAMESRVAMDSNGRMCLVETTTPLQFGGRSNARDIGNIIMPMEAMSFNFEDQGRPMLLDAGALGGFPMGQVGSRQGFPPCHNAMIRLGSSENGGPNLIRTMHNNTHGTTSEYGLVSNRQGGERIMLLADALFRMLDDMESQLNQSGSRTGPQPAPPGAVDVLATRVYSSAAQSGCREEKIKNNSHDESHIGSTEECYVCLSEYVEGEQLRVLPCKHEFHAACVDKWLKEVHRVCPLCRASVCDTRETSPTCVDLPSSFRTGAGNSGTSS
mmetsp:Transcript_40080/g.55694  ORF Transcript_40080/g.55694 Transcript_40080/m.55694 type:complete len:277 (-) Transcript_40080:342-1172(-)|eukprot:CAMPEP_0196578014 /NCGR_PEP_ID=MMETSP1081-20130531/6990_1 /TAXON_ID=36882 /ORGANISM="Pyramimonas amylifera, Strain CCMP720" /LENGTH=276 /DNA_ID=CAMNT_0041897103 /DNA_START=178 /DNA_END=1008 /DNA_ORIENTATION=+